MQLNTDRELITESADLHFLTLEPLTDASMAAMGDLLDRMEAKMLRWRAAATPPARVQA
ncbi:MAG: hypothetical protein ACK4JY_03925 [Brevundimonas sp.]|uniref:hypothetical protein n=1 Tax=Brevundimonas sp. TaxID=1871086 RepID=UPI00391D1CCB